MAASGLLQSSWDVYVNGGRYAPYLAPEANGKLRVLAPADLSESDFRTQVTQSKAVGDAPSGRLNEFYRLERIPLGTGGYAEVFRAVHRESGEVVAVKRPKGVPGAQERLRREIDVMTKLKDRHVMPLLDHEEEYAWYCMPEARGSLVTLKTECEDLAAMRRLVSESARGLAAGHAAGLVHRDVTPGNLLLLPVPDERWVVADWGTVRRPRGETTVQATAEGQLLGTEGFAAPELWVHAHEADARADIYGLGRVVAWLCGMVLVPNVPAIPANAWRPFVEATTKLSRDERPKNIDEAVRLIP